MPRSAGDAADSQQRGLALSKVELLVGGLGALLVGVLWLIMSNGRFYFLEGGSSADILFARGFVEGQGFRETWRLGQPYCTVRAPGLAFFLSLVIRVAGFDLFYLKLVNNLFGPLGFMAALILLRNRLGSFAGAFLVSLLCYTLPFWIRNGLYLYSGGAYAALVLWSLVAIERGLSRQGRSVWSLLAFAGLAGTAVMTRSIGVGIFAAALISLLWVRTISFKWRALWIGAVVLSAALSFGLWSVRNYQTPASADDPYLSKLMVGEPWQSLYWLAEDHGTPIIPTPRKLTPARLLLRLKDNSYIYLTRSLETLIPALHALPAGSVSIISGLWVAFTALGLTGMALRTRRPSELFALTSLGVIWLWPFPHTRFIIPILPILLMANVWSMQRAAGLIHVIFRSTLASRASSPKPHAPLANAALTALALAVIAANSAQNIKIVRERFDKPVFVIKREGMDMVASNLQVFHSMLLLDEIRKKAPREATVMFHSIPACGLVAERVCQTIPMAAPAQIIEYLDQHDLDLVLMDNEGGLWGAAYFSHHYLRPTIEKYRHRFEPWLWITPPPGDTTGQPVVYKVIR